MAKKDSIILVINFDEYHPKFNEKEIMLFTNYTIIDTKGFYDKNYQKIQKALDTTNRGRILEVLFYKKKTNALELAGLIRAPYSLIRQYIDKLRALRLIILEKGTSEKGRREVAITLHPGVKLIQYSKFVESSDFKRVVKDEKELAMQAEEEYRKILDKKMRKKNLNNNFFIG